MKILPLFAVAVSSLIMSACASSRSLGASFGDLDAGARIDQIIRTEKAHDYRDVDVTLFEGRLLFTGTVESEEARQHLINAAWSVDAISQIIDETYVGENTTFGQGVADSRIDTEIRVRLTTHRDVKASDVKIAVSNGVVYLLGVARDQQTLEAVLNVARTSRGAHKVVSHLLYIDEPYRRL